MSSALSTGTSTHALAAAAVDACSDCCTLYDDCADCSSLSLSLSLAAPATAAAAPWHPSSSELLACCAAPFPPHLAWCCDDAECLPSTSTSTSTTGAARVSSPGSNLDYDSTVASHSAAATTTPTEDWMRWSAAALATATATAPAGLPRTGAAPPSSPCLDPTCNPAGGVVVALPPPESSTLANCPSCTAGPSTSSLTGTPVTTTTTTEDHPQHGLDQDGLPHTDLDELLNGLDEETIQDIVRLPPLLHAPLCLG